jgi:hypothetical protein
MLRKRRLNPKEIRRSLRGGFGENLQERVNFNSFKDTVNRIGVMMGEVFSLLLRLKF